MRVAAQILQRRVSNGNIFPLTLDYQTDTESVVPQKLRDAGRPAARFGSGPARPVARRIGKPAE